MNLLYLSLIITVRLLNDRDSDKKNRVETCSYFCHTKNGSNNFIKMNEHDTHPCINSD
jgi:hypothetical protein